MKRTGAFVLFALMVIGGFVGFPTIANAAQSHPSRGRPGIGATVKAWKRAYKVDQGPGALCSARNSCFGPPVRNGDSGKTYEFTNVSATSGVVTGYQENFPKATPLATVETAIARTLPKGSVLGNVVDDTHTGSCGIIDLTIPKLAKTLGKPKIGDPSGSVGILLSDIIGTTLRVAYSPNNIQTVTVSISPFKATEGC